MPKGWLLENRLRLGKQKILSVIVQLLKHFEQLTLAIGKKGDAFRFFTQQFRYSTIQTRCEKIDSFYRWVFSSDSIFERAAWEMPAALAS